MIAKMLLVVGPVAVLAAALLTMLATLAKGFREAQSYMGLVIFIPMIPSLIYMTNPMKPEAWMMTIPMFSQNLLIAEFLRGEAVPMSWLYISSRRHAGDRAVAGRLCRHPVQPAQGDFFRLIRLQRRRPGRAGCPVRQKP